VSETMREAMLTNSDPRTCKHRAGWRWNGAVPRTGFKVCATCGARWEDVPAESDKKGKHFCKGCGRARYVGGTTVFVCERPGKDCPRRKA